MQDAKPTVVMGRSLLSGASGKETETPPITVRFGAIVRSWRRRSRISQETLAERADLHRTYIADVEAGRRNVTLKTMERLAQALEVSLAVLMAQTVEWPALSVLAAAEPSNDNGGGPAPKP